MSYSEMIVDDNDFAPIPWPPVVSVEDTACAVPYVLPTVALLAGAVVIVLALAWWGIQRFRPW